MRTRQPGAVRSALPLGRDDAARFLPWVFALVVYLAGLGGVGLLVTDATRQNWENSLAATVSVVVPADASPARMETVLALLRQTPGIVAVRELTPAETARLLKPWLGSAAPLAELPVPRLIDLRIDPRRTVDFATLRQHLASVEPDAQLDDHSAWLPGMQTAARRIAVVFAAWIAGALVSMAALSVYAARATLAARQSAVELVHQLGATDGRIARSFAIRALRASLPGGAIGAAAVLATVAALGGTARIAALPGPLAAAGIADWRVWAIAIGAGVAAAVIAVVISVAVVRRRLARMP